MRDSDDRHFDRFVAFYKEKMTGEIARELLQSLDAYGIKTDEFFYALADALRERGIEPSATRLEQAGELFPLGFSWKDKDNEQLPKNNTPD